MDLSKCNSFLTEEAINFIARTEKRKKVPVCEMLESSVFLSPFLIETEDRQVYNFYIISLSCFFNKVMTSWYYAVTKSLIIDDVGVRDLPLVCLFPVQNTTKKIKIQQNRHLPVQSQKEEH